MDAQAVPDSESEEGVSDLRMIAVVQRMDANKDEWWWCGCIMDGDVELCEINMAESGYLPTLDAAEDNVKYVASRLDIERIEIRETTA